MVASDPKIDLNLPTTYNNIWLLQALVRLNVVRNLRSHLDYHAQGYKTFLTLLYEGLDSAYPSWKVICHVKNSFHCREARQELHG